MTAKDQILVSEESVLLQSVAAGDRHAFQMLVDANWKRVYGNIFTLIKSPETAQEITQDVFLKIWTLRDKLSAIRHFHEYIYVVCRHQVISELRKKLARPAHLPEDLPEDLPDDPMQPDRQLQYKETYSLIMQGVAKLSPQQQLIFKMSRIDGLSHVDIAHQLGLSKNTVKGHIVLALNFLRSYVRERLDPALIFVAFSSGSFLALMT